MVIMKTLSNNRGVALIVLIVAMTLIAILGTSFVSLMGSKQKGFLYQIDSYRALNLANAGVEYAIRYVYQIGLSDTKQSTCSFQTLVFWINLIGRGLICRRNILFIIIYL